MNPGIWHTCSACGRTYRTLAALHNGAVNGLVTLGSVVGNLCGLCLVALRQFQARVRRLETARLQVQSGARTEWPGTATTRTNGPLDPVVGALLSHGFTILRPSDFGISTHEADAGEADG